MYIKNIDILMKKIQQDYGCSQTCNTGSDLKYALSFHVIDLNYIYQHISFLFVSFLVEIKATQQKNFWPSFFYRSSRRKQL